MLTLEDVGMVAWLCSQVDPGSLLSHRPPVLSQQILLSLIQQLGYNMFKVRLPVHHTIIQRCHPAAWIINGPARHATLLQAVRPMLCPCAGHFDQAEVDPKHLHGT